MIGSGWTETEAGSGWLLRLNLWWNLRTFERERFEKVDVVVAVVAVVVVVHYIAVLVDGFVVGMDYGTGCDL
jgi:hypothetical protein